MDTKRYWTRWQLVEAVDDVFIAARVSSFTANSLHSPLSKMLVGGGDTLVSPEVQVQLELLFCKALNPALLLGDVQNILGRNSEDKNF